MENQKAMPFSMPMFRSWVPKRIQPWIYIAQVICIQFSCGVYLGAMEAVRGTTALQLEDLLMLLYAGLAGMAVWFPMLFRTKFRFTNQQLLITSAVVIAVCNFITMRTTNMAILLPVCFLAGVAKIQGTFECMSNIQLWMTPERDFGIFFPILHIMQLLRTGSIAQQIADQTPEMNDIGILASLDPVALDQACVDLVFHYPSKDGDDAAALIERINSRHGIHILEQAAKIGLGSREYQLVSID